MQMDDKKVAKVAIVANKYICNICDYNTIKLYNYSKHCLTAKHKRNDTECNNVAKVANKNQVHECDCGMVYKYRQGLHKHLKTCSVKKQKEIIEEELTDKQLILKLLHENTEMRKALVDTCGKLQSNTVNNNTTNNNISNNKTFNLQFFLNETCKNALNINDFVSSIQFKLSDLETTGRIGYVEGITKIILNNLKDLTQDKRPIHCSDLKREVLYIKDNDQWEKEDSEKPILTKAIKVIANENIKKITDWKNENPNCSDSDSKQNNFYLKIISNSMNGSTQDESTKNTSKIISNVAKEVVIDK